VMRNARDEGAALEPPRAFGGAGASGMISLASFFESLCGPEGGKRALELLEGCTMLRSGWILVAEGGRAVAIELSYAEDEPYVTRVAEATVLSEDEDWTSIAKAIGECRSPRILKGGGVVLSLCEDEGGPAISSASLVCEAERPVVLCPDEWA